MLKFIKIATKFIKILIISIILILTIFLLFSLWGIYRTSDYAYKSYDLSKYKPKIQESNELSLDEMIEINQDTVGWITVNGTNIDYPIVKGKTNSEYINRTPLREISPAGSIFLDSRNSKDFSDKYNIIYGHHIINGTMFGDLDKFLKKDFFYNKNNCRYKDIQGTLITKNKVYILNIFSVIETDAYDNYIYNAKYTNDNLDELISYSVKKSKYYRNISSTGKIIALSTCKDAESYGRLILLCYLKETNIHVISNNKESKKTNIKFVQHKKSSWALLNLLIMALTIYISFPFHLIRQIESLKSEYLDDSYDRILKIKHKIILFQVVLTVLSVLSLIVFTLTEDLHKFIDVSDNWTYLMMLILVVTLILKNKQFKEREFYIEHFKQTSI